VGLLLQRGGQLARGRGGGCAADGDRADGERADQQLAADESGEE